VALEEALVNALRHGNKNDPDKQVRCRYLVEPGQTMVEVEDDGPGFDCGQIPELTNLKSGRPSSTANGLALIRVLMGWVAFNNRGNRLVMGRNRSRG
jgi:serine/threonine-protein kinase RsbW